MTSSSPDGQKAECGGGYECRNAPHFEGCLSGDHETRLASLILGEAPTITNWADAGALADAILKQGWRPPVDGTEVQWSDRVTEQEQQTQFDAIRLIVFHAVDNNLPQREAFRMIARVLHPDGWEPPEDGSTIQWGWLDAGGGFVVARDEEQARYRTKHGINRTLAARVVGPAREVKE